MKIRDLKKIVCCAANKNVCVESFYDDGVFYFYKSWDDFCNDNKIDDLLLDENGHCFSVYDNSVTVWVLL